MCLPVNCFLKYDEYVCVRMYTDTHVRSFGILSMIVTLYLTDVCLLDHLFQAWKSSRTKYPPSVCQGLSLQLYWKPLLLNAVHSRSGSYPLRPVFALHLILHSGGFPPHCLYRRYHLLLLSRQYRPWENPGIPERELPCGVISSQPLTGNGVGVFEKSRSSCLDQISSWDCVSNEQGAGCQQRAGALHVSLLILGCQLCGHSCWASDSEIYNKKYGFGLPVLVQSSWNYWNFLLENSNQSISIIQNKPLSVTPELC